MMFRHAVLTAAVLVGPAARSVDAQRVATQNTDGSERTTNAALDQRISVELKGVPLDQALRAAGAAAHVSILYNGTRLARYQRVVSLRVANEPLRTVLARMLAGTPLQPVARPNGTVLILDGGMDAADSLGTVTGVVLDSATRRPIGRVTVHIDGTKLSTLTSDSGRFTIRSVPLGQRLVSARLFGYTPGRRQITVGIDDPAVVNLILVHAPTQLSGVVTTATGLQKRMDVGSDITSLDVDSIMKVAPVRTVTDVLENRVPGLVVQHQSGAPGAPARLRIRGVGSINASNDPIIIVDGVRSYSEQTSERSPNDEKHSVLDNFDVNAIERVEVLKGPSASSLYGSDAANGVIVITTKRGRAGPPHWNFSTQQQRSTQTNTLPPIYYRQGTTLNSPDPDHCVLGGAQPCFNDTLFVIDPLRDARTTVLGVGRVQAYAGDVRGGTSTLQYFLSGEWRATQSPIKMSDADVAYVERTTKQSAPNWQRHPLTSSAGSGTSQVTAQVTPQLAVALVDQIARTSRQSTPYADVLGVYEGTTLTPRDTLIVTGSLIGFRQRTTSSDLSLRNTLSADWTPHAGWRAHGDVGYQTLSRNDKTLLRRGDCSNTADCAAVQLNSLGSLTQDDGSRSVTTATFIGSAPSLQVPGFGFGPTVGVQYSKQSASDISFSASQLALGAATTSGAKDITLEPERLNDLVQLGLYYDVNVLVFNRFRTSFGSRLDASNSLGKKVTPTYPKLSLSYPLSQESFFPFKSTINALRLRFAYGHAAVQPELEASERTYLGYTDIYDPQLGGGPLQKIESIGNPNLRPERSTELEAGFDIDLFGSRLTFTFTGDNKVSRDALVKTNLPLSLGNFAYWSNLGSVRNTSTEITASAVVFDRPALRWSVSTNYSRLRNRLESIAPGFDQSLQTQVGVGVNGDLSSIYGYRYVVGYPITGTWMRPVVSYADANGDGVLNKNEIVRSDSLVFVGTGLPSYELNPSTQVGLFDGKLTLSAQFHYEHAIAQVNQALLSNAGGGGGPGSTLRALNDPSTSIDDQAFVRSGYAALHTSSLLRFSSLQANFLVPPKIASRLFRASSASIAIEGRNLRLWTNYSGIDPNVSGSILGNQIADPGVLPTPREWGINVNLTY